MAEFVAVPVPCTNYFLPRETSVKRILSVNITNF